MASVEDRIIRLKWDASQFTKAVQNTLTLLNKVKTTTESMASSVLNSTTKMTKGLTDVAKNVSKISGDIKDNASKLKDGFSSVEKSISKIGDGVKDSTGKLTGVFKDAKDGITDLQNKFDSFKTEDFQKAIENVNSHFTLMGRIGEEAIGKIASAVTNIGATIAGKMNELVFAPISTGFNEYGLLMDSTQVILANSGESLERIDETLEKLNHYADKTIYNFAHMTNAIGRFTAAGVGLDDSVAAIEGLSNLSALVGVSAEQNSNAMDALSKALSSGYMQQKQWLSFELTGGLAGKTFRDELIKTADELGYFGREWSTAGGKAISGSDLLAKAQQEFRTTLAYGWVDKDVLLQTLAKFNDETTELGQRAIKAATEVRTFTKLWDALTEAVQSSWSETYKYIFGGYEEGTTFWTAINDEVSKYIGLVGDSRNEMLKFWHDNGGREATIEGLAKAWSLLKESITPVADAIKEVFPWFKLEGYEKGGRLVELSQNFRNFADSLSIGESPARIMYERVVELGQGIKSLFKVVGSFNRNGGLNSLFEGFMNSANYYANIVSSIYYGIRHTLTDETDKLGAKLSEFAKVFERYTKLISTDVWVGNYSDISDARARKMAGIIYGLTSPIKNLIKLVESIDTESIFGILISKFDIMLRWLDSLSVAVEKAFDKTNVSWFNDFLYKIERSVKQIKDYLYTDDAFNKLTNMWTGLLSIIKLVANVVSQIASFFYGNFIEGKEASILDKLLTIASATGTWVTNLTQAVEKYNVISNALSVVKSFIDPIVKAIGTIFSDIVGIIEGLTGIDLPFNDRGWLNNLETSAQDSSDAISTAFSDFNDNLYEISSKANEYGTIIANVMERVSGSIKTVYDASVAFLGPVVSYITDTVAGAVASLKDMYDTFAGNKATAIVIEQEGEVPFIMERPDTLAEKLDKLIKDHNALNAAAAEAGETVSGWLESAITLADDLVDRLLGSAVGENWIGKLITPLGLFYNQLKKIMSLNVVPMLQNIADIIGTLASTFAQAIQDVFSYKSKTDAITTIFDALAKAVQWLHDVITSDWGVSVLTRTFSGGLSILRLIVDVIAQIVTGLKKVYDRINANGAVTSMIETAMNVIGGFSRYFGDLVRWIERAVRHTGLVEKFFDVIGALAAPVADTISSVHTAIESLYTTLTGLDFTNLEIFKAPQRIFGPAKTTIMSFAEWASNGLSSLADKIGLGFSDVKEASADSMLTPDDVKEAEAVFDPKDPSSYFSVATKSVTEGAKITGGVISTVFDKLKAILSNAWDGFGKILKRFTVWAGLEDFDIETAWANLKDSIGKGFDGFVERVKGFFNNPIIVNLKSILSNFVMSVINFFTGTAPDAFHNAIEGIKAYPGIIGEQISAWFEEHGKDYSLSGILEALKAPFVNAYEALAKWFESTGIAEYIQPIKEKINTVFGILHDLFGDLATFLRGNADTINIDGIMGNVTELIKIWGETKIFGLFGSVSKRMDSITKIFDRFREKEDGILDSIKQLIDKTGSSASTVNTKLGGMFENFGKAAEKIADNATGVTKIFSKAFEKVGVRYAKTIERVSGQWKKVGEIFAKGARKMMDDFGKGARRYLTGAAINEAAEGLLKFSVAVIILVAAIGAISMISDKDLKRGGLVLLGIVAVLLIVLFCLYKFRGDASHADNDLEALSGVFGNLKKSLDNLIKGITGALNKIGNAAIILAFVAALYVIVNAVKDFAKLQPEQLVTGVVAVVVLLIALAGSLALLFAISNKKKFSVTQLLAMVAVIFVLKTMVSAIKKLAKLSPEQVIVGGIAVVGMLVAFAIAMGILYATSNGKSMTLRQILAMVAVAEAVNILASAVKKLAKIKKGLAGAVAAVAILSLCLAGMIFFASLAPSSMADVFAIVALAGAVWVMADSVKKLARIDRGDMEAASHALEIMMGMFALMEFGSSGLSGTSLAGIALMGIIVAEVAGLLYLLTEKLSDVDKYKKIADGLSEVIGVLGGVATALAFAGKYANIGDALEGIAMYDLLIADMIAVMEGIGALFTWLDSLGKGGQATAFLDVAVEVFGKIGQAIGDLYGNIIGGIVGGTIEGAGAAIENLGTQLSNFMTNLQPFLEGVKNIKADQFDGLGALAGCVLTITGTNILNAISSFFGGGKNPYDDFTKGIKDLGPALSEFYESTKDVEGRKIKAVTRALSDFITAISEIPNQGGVIADIFGDNKLTDFAKGLRKFTGPFSRFLKKMADVDFTDGKDKNVKKAIAFADAVCEFAEHAPKSGGVIQNIFGETDLTQFGTNLEEFGPKFKTFLEAVGNASYDENAVTQAITFAEALAGLYDKLKGVSDATSLNGIGDLEAFGQDLEKFSPHFTKFLTDVTHAKYNEATARRAITFAESLAGVSEKLEGKAGLISALFTGDHSLSGIGEGMDTFSSALLQYSENIKAVDWDLLDRSVTYISGLLGLVQNVDGIDFLANATFDQSLVNLASLPQFLSESLTVAFGDPAVTDTVTAESKGIGQNIIDGIRDGITDKDGNYYANVFGTLRNSLKASFGNIREFFGISESTATSGYLFDMGVQTVSAIVEGINSESKTLRSTTRNGGIKAVNSYSTAMQSEMDTVMPTILSKLKDHAERMVVQLTSRFVSMLDENKSFMSSFAFGTFDAIGGEAGNGISRHAEDFFVIGENLMVGFINGVNSRAQQAYDAIMNIGNITTAIFANQLGVHSPSTVAYSDGEYFILGFINAVKAGGSKIDATMKSVFAKPLNTVEALLNEDFEYTPKIRPVVDLDDIDRSTKAIDGVFASRSLAFTEDALKLSEANRKNRALEAKRRTYNDKNVVSAINGLRGDINGLNTAMSNYGLYLDGDTLVGRLTDKIDRNLATNQIRRKRGI